MARAVTTTPTVKDALSHSHTPSLGADGGGSLPVLTRSRFHARRLPSATLPVDADAQQFRAAIRANVPETPGVYAMVDSEHTVAYVGKSVQLRQRVLNYFVDVPTGRNGKAHPRKEHRVGLHARELLWQPVGHELVALLRELELIQALRPRFNVRGAPDRGRSGYLYLTADEAPTFRTGAQPPAKAHRVWGPMLLTRPVRESVERLNHTFGLRDCTTQIAITYRDQGLLWDEPFEAGCLRAAFGACLSPCVQGCSREEYAAAIRRAIAFLDGDDRSILNKVDEQMTEAAENYQFEKAARLRDTWDALDLLDAELALLRETPDGRAAFVLPVPDGHGKQQWLLFSGGVAVSAVIPPTTPARAAQLTSSLHALRPTAPRPLAAALKVDFECESVRTIAGWFRQNPAALDSALSVEDAVSLCRGLAS